MEHLEQEGYSKDACIFAADNCNADWGEQALKSAEAHVENGNYSYSSLLNQLEKEGFAEDQAKYGADNCEANWKE